MRLPPVIQTLPDGTERPLWSVMIPVYNCSSYLPSTLQSVLEQDPGREVMQIEVVDDASSDADVSALVERIGKGRVSYYRQAQNVGSLRNFETCLNRSRGQLVHLLHGDDRVRFGYYQKMTSLFHQYPSAGAAFCPYDTIDENGKILWHHYKEMDHEGLLEDWLEKIASRQRLQVCTISVKREVYEKLGGFYGVTYGEDWEMWARIAAHYPVAYSPETLAEYRMHKDSISSRSFATAQNLRDMRWVIGQIQQLVPDNKKKKVKRDALKHNAHYALNIANSIWHQTGDKKTTQLQIREALKMHLDGMTLWEAGKIGAKMLINRR